MARLEEGRLSARATPGAKAVGAFHHGDLRRAALAEALSLIEREGEEALSLRGLSERLGVNHRALYRHFTDKSALVDQVAAAGFAQLVEAIERRVADGGNAPSRLAMDAYLDFAFARPRLYRLMFRQPLRRRFRDPRLGAELRRLVELAAAVFSQSDHGDSGLELRDRVMRNWGAAHGLIDLYACGGFRARTPADAKRYILSILF